MKKCISTEDNSTRFSSFTMRDVSTSDISQLELWNLQDSDEKNESIDVGLVDRAFIRSPGLTFVLGILWEEENPMCPIHCRHREEVRATCCSSQSWQTGFC